MGPAADRLTRYGVRREGAGKRRQRWTGSVAGSSGADSVAGWEAKECRPTGEQAAALVEPGLVGDEAESGVGLVAVEACGDKVAGDGVDEGYRECLSDDFVVDLRPERVGGGGIGGFECLRWPDLVVEVVVAEPVVDGWGGAAVGAE